MKFLRPTSSRWYVRQTVALSVLTIVVLALGAIQALRWRENPAVYSITLLVTVQIAFILVFLMLRHRRRQAPKETVAAACVGCGLAVLLTLMTPRLASKPERVSLGPVYVAQPFEPAQPHRMSVAPVRLSPMEEVSSPPVIEKTALETRPEPEPPPAPVPVPPPVQSSDESERPELVVFSRLQEDPPWPRQRQEQEVLQEVLRHGLPSKDDAAALPSMHAGVALYLASIDGRLGTEEFNAPLDDFLGGEKFQTAAEVQAEFPLSPRQVLRVSMIALRISESGLLDEDVEIGSEVLSQGTSYEFEMQWAHTFIGFSQRFAGYRRESRFDFSAHLGAVLEHLSGTLKTSETEEKVAISEASWAAPAFGMSFGFWDGQGGGLTLELMESIPVNIGGQTLAVTDLRITLQGDLSESISILIGYRRVLAAFKRFENPVEYGGDDTVSRLDVGGPLVGLDLRF